METVDDIFSELGGTGAVATMLEVNHSTASEMRRRGTIPVKYWPKLTSGAAAAGKKLSNDDLVRAHTEKAPAPAPSEEAAA